MMISKDKVQEVCMLIKEDHTKGSEPVTSSSSSSCCLDHSADSFFLFVYENIAQPLVNETRNDKKDSNADQEDEYVVIVGSHPLLLLQSRSL